MRRYWRVIRGVPKRRRLEQYLVALDYMSDMPLSANAEHLQRICRAFAPEEQAAIDTVVFSRFFVATPKGYTNSRAVDEIESASARIETARQNAKSRWGAAKKGAVVGARNADGNADGNTDGNTIQKPDGVGGSKV